MRTDPPNSGSELELLSGFLDFLRETVLLKTEGLTREQLAQPHPPSTLTLGGLLNHLALVEDWWFRVNALGLPHVEPWAAVDWTADPDFEFRTAADLEPEELRARYREACDRSREVVARAQSLDQPTAQPPREGGTRNLRWVLIHMIEETGRHAGHADLLREAIDGTTGE
ncbi:DinB family protein [Geodermatophilus sp. URMC 64]